METSPGRTWSASRTRGSDAEEEWSSLEREESMRLTNSTSGRRVTASLSVSVCGIWSDWHDRASGAQRSLLGMCLKVRLNSERSSNHHACH